MVEELRVRVAALHVRHNWIEGYSFDRLGCWGRWSTGHLVNKQSIVIMIAIVIVVSTAIAINHLIR